MGNQKKSYSGSIKDEISAAKIYDKLAIKNLGLRAKTNFDYKKRDLIKIIAELDHELDKEVESLRIRKDRRVFRNKFKNILDRN